MKLVDAKGMSAPLFSASEKILSASESASSFFVADSSAVARNAEEFSADFPEVKLCHDVAACDDELVLGAMSADVSLFGCNNRAELEAALPRVGADRIAFLNPIKPAAQIRFALKRGVSTVACGSPAEVEKVHRAFRQFQASGSDRNAPRLLVSVDVSELAEGRNELLPRLTEMMRGASERRMAVAGVHLFANSRSVLEDAVDGKAETIDCAVKKSIAVSRLAFEIGSKLGHPMDTFDVGHCLDYDDGDDDKEEGFKQSTREESKKKRIWDLIKLQFSTYNNGLGIESINVYGHASKRLLREAICLCTKILDERHERDRVYLVVSESIFGAFRGAFLTAPNKPPRLIKVGATARDEEIPRFKTCDVFGDSGTDFDVIARGLAVFGGNLASRGDWLLFPDVERGPCSTLPLYLVQDDGGDEVRIAHYIGGDASLSFGSSGGGPFLDDVEDTAFFVLPDMSEDALCRIFAISAIA